MKTSVVILFIIGIYGCGDEEFNLNGYCVSCSRSTCDTCNGSPVCDSCPYGISMINDGRCLRCNSQNTMIFKKSCVSCYTFGCVCTIGPSDDLGDRGNCYCPSPNRDCCDEKKGVVFYDGRCVECSVLIENCSYCTRITLTTSGEDYKYECYSCDEGYVKMIEPGKDHFKCVKLISSASYIFSCLSMIITLLLLF